MSPARKVRRELKKTGLLQEGMMVVEKTEISNILNGKPKKRDMSLIDYLSHIESSKGGQITSKITVQVSDMIMDWLVFEANEFLKKKGSPLRIKPKKSIITQLKGDAEFDICFEIDGVEVLFEIKMSQNDNTFQGSTHGKNKVDDFIMIQFKVDQHMVVKDENKGILGHVWVGVTKEKPKFIGEPSTTSSRTGFSYKKDEYSVEDMEDCTIFGSSKPNKTKHKLIGKKLYE